MSEITRASPFWRSLNDFHKQQGKPMRGNDALRFFFQGNDLTVGELIENVRIAEGKVFVPFDESWEHFKVGGRYGELTRVQNVGERGVKLVLDFYEAMAPKLKNLGVQPTQAAKPDEPGNLETQVEMDKIETKFRQALASEQLKTGLNSKGRKK